MKNMSITPDISEISGVIDSLRDVLNRKKVPQKEIARTLLVAEDVLVKMIQNATGDKIDIFVGGILGSVEIRLVAKGKKFDTLDIEKNLLLEEGNEEINSVIHNLIEKLYGERFVVQNEHGKNKVLIATKKSQFFGLFVTLFALFAGIGTGLILQNFFPSTVSKSVSDNVFSPIYTVFMNALKMIVAPLVFCSVASSIADFGDLKALGRIAFKIVLIYLFTSFLAICTGYATFSIFPIGNENLSALVSDAAASTVAKSQNINISIKDTLIGIIPNNIITPFQKSDMLQLIFMAVVLGLGASSLSKKYPQIKIGISIANRLFSKITAVIVSFIPLIVFCAMAKMMVSMKFENLLDVFVWVPVVYAGDVLMICVYLVLLFVFARINPFKFLGKYYPAMISAFTLAASNPALPFSLKQCDEMGVSRRVSSFSLPLGATINMDGSCVSLIITSLFMAKIFGIPITSDIFLKLALAIMVLSVGSPGVPGGNLVCITLIIPQIGIPAEAVSLVMGLYPLVGMMQTCVNVTGDAVVTTIVAKQEKLLDMEKYNRKR